MSRVPVHPMRAGPPPERTARRAVIVTALALGACAALPRIDPVTVDVVGLEPLAGQGLESRFLVKLRVQNPNDTAIVFDGVYVELDLRGQRLASGVSDAQGSVPRFGEVVLSVPVTIPVTALFRQALGMAAGDASRADYRLRGKLAGPALGSVRFESRGELALPQARPDPSGR